MCAAGSRRDVCMYLGDNGDDAAVTGVAVE